MLQIYKIRKSAQTETHPNNSNCNLSWKLHQIQFQIVLQNEKTFISNNVDERPYVDVIFQDITFTGQLGNGASMSDLGSGSE